MLAGSGELGSEMTGLLWEVMMVAKLRELGGEPYWSGNSNFLGVSNLLGERFPSNMLLMCLGCSSGLGGGARG